MKYGSQLSLGEESDESGIITLPQWFLLRVVLMTGKQRENRGNKSRVVSSLSVSLETILLLNHSGALRISIRSMCLYLTERETILSSLLPLHSLYSHPSSRINFRSFVWKKGGRGDE